TPVFVVCWSFKPLKYDADGDSRWVTYNSVLAPESNVGRVTTGTGNRKDHVLEATSSTARGNAAPSSSRKRRRDTRRRPGRSRRRNDAYSSCLGNYGPQAVG